MLRALLSNSNTDPMNVIVSILLQIPIIMLILPFHEVAHGYVAYKLGDPTARSMGRLTLNPLKHFDLIGFAMMLLVGFGWAKPVPINTRYFKKPKRDMALTALAGPLSNIILAVVFALLLRIMYAVLAAFPPTSEFTVNIYFWTRELLMSGVVLNVAFAVFNMIPVPPFDGSRILFSFLPSDLYFKIMRYEQYIYIAMLVLLVTGILNVPLRAATNFISEIILRIVLF